MLPVRVTQTNHHGQQHAIGEAMGFEVADGVSQWTGEQDVALPEFRAKYQHHQLCRTV